ncbi:MAG: SDR family oxidoreductase [Bdellovibrionales bacterium]|nr:SDR family oxidoreductase [Bdellovibrionales bacterium]
MNTLSNIASTLAKTPKKWLVTGGAGFIGSNLAEFLLLAKQDVTVLDNLSTGYQKNIDTLKSIADKEKANFTFIKGDIVDYQTCLNATKAQDFILHQAALGSVPRSIELPLDSHLNNVDGTLNVFLAAKENGIQRVVYASSSSVYGDSQEMPKVEDVIGTPLSPYAITKLVNEVYAKNFSQIYGIEMIGLRYFNVFGPRQDPDGAYAAVIPKWIKSLIQDQPVSIFGDGETSRDFCYIQNVVLMNILASLKTNKNAINQVYNVACNERTTLNDLYKIIVAELKAHHPHVENMKAEYKDFRPGDIRHSLANIEKAQKLLNYAYSHTLQQGMKESIPWYINNI